LPDALRFHFSGKLQGMIWKTIADPDRKRIYLEVRNGEEKSVSFSAFDLDTSRWLWEGITFEEKWWISLSAASAGILLFTLYAEVENPDKKSLLAFDVELQKMIWWKNNFALSLATGQTVTGVETKFGAKEIVLDIYTGMEARKDVAKQNLNVIRPFQYPEGSSDFDTVSAFLEVKCGFSPCFSVEYCEHHALIFISAFVDKTDLANYLIVFNSKGEMVLKETLGEHLKGIAPDTFFIYSGFLIFVKNKCELVSYKLYD
jgi:hypothetical protein